jgi:hypothetical protein
LRSIGTTKVIVNPIPNLIQSTEYVVDCLQIEFQKIRYNVASLEREYNSSVIQCNQHYGKIVQILMKDENCFFKIQLFEIEKEICYKMFLAQITENFAWVSLKKIKKPLICFSNDFGFVLSHHYYLLK